MNEDSDWQTYLKYINIDLKYVEEQRLNLLSKYNKIVFELNKCRDDLLALKQAKLEAVTFQIQNTELTKLNHALQDQLKEERKVNEKWLNSFSKVSQCISEQIPNQQKKILGGEQLTESLSKIDGKENPSIPASLDYDHEMCLQLTEAPSDLETSKESGSEPQTPLSPLKNIQGASPSSEDSKPNGKNPDTSKQVRPKPLQKPKFKCELYNYTNHQTDDCYGILYCIKYKKEDHMTSYHDMYTTSLKSSQNYKAQPYQYDSPSKQKSKAKPYLPCTHCGFNDHRPDDCRNYPECEICRSYDHFTSGHNRVIHVKGGVLAESSQSSESSIGVSCTTCGSNVHSTTNHNDFEHFKRGEKLQATKAKEP
ncbi:hypothetical protein Tco_1400217 [Tanacetum coccineum]